MVILLKSTDWWGCSLFVVAIENDMTFALLAGK